VAPILEANLADPALARTQLVLLPSAADAATSQPAYPQWPLQPGDLAGFVDPEVRRRITVVSNPATFVVGGAIFGATSADVLFALNGEDATRQPGPAAAASSAQRLEKIPRMALHLLEQRSYYPLFPAPRMGDAPLEMSQLWHTGASCS
jgi:DNA polymerase alpha subunit B